MIRFLIVRHGNSTANNEAIFAGKTDIPLSPVGIKQAEITCRYISENYKVDNIYSSELERAYKTVEPLALSLGIKIEKIPAFNEIFGGVWEKMKFIEIAKKYPAEFSLWLNDIGNSHCPEGESFKELTERVYNGLCDLADKSVDGTTNVIGTHAGVIRGLQCKIENVGTKDMKNVNWVSNGSVSTVVFENGKITEYRFGFDEFMGEMKTALPQNI